MCGIAGFVGGTDLGDEGRAALLDRMCRVIRHRGPDDQGTSIRPGVALGMRRLAIIDLAGGHQPMSSADGAVTLVFNGEIYNYRELRRELAAEGHAFETDSDTEVILRAYEAYGARCVDRLRGMFAFAIWDARRNALFVARDRLGKKPLYYARTASGGLVFGSEVKSLLEHPGVGRTTSPEAIDAYLTLGYVPDPLCIFREIAKLPPAHTLELRDGRLTVAPYWDVRFEEGPPRRVEELLEELRAILDESVRMRMIADVPLGAFLSGGVDSSAVVGMMARASDRPVKTFSIGFREDSYDELAYARVAARRFETDHHEFVVTPEICEIVDDLVWHFDEPFADSSAIPTYMVSKLAREHVTVVLTGDGGDEVFAGYTRYAIDRARSGFERIPSAVRRGVMLPLARRMPHGALGRNFLRNVALDPIDRYLDSVAVFTELDKVALYSDGLRAELGGRSILPALRATADRVATGDPLDRLLYLDTKSYLPGDILTKVDRTSMAVSLEARAPLLDHTLVEFAARVPSSLKLRDGETKHLFKRAVADLVPAEIRNRPKQGFGVPIDAWINRELRDRIRETITTTRAVGRGLVDPSAVRVLLDEHERGRRDHASRLWSLFMLESWFRMFVDGERVAAPQATRAAVVGDAA